MHNILKEPKDWMLPEEITLKIFSYLTFEDLTRASQVFNIIKNNFN